MVANCKHGLLILTYSSFARNKLHGYIVNYLNKVQLS